MAHLKRHRPQNVVFAEKRDSQADNAWRTADRKMVAVVG